ncbi:NAD-dependent epimerase/dehydratase family protein, partial [Candidatus Latescibacterota bacterium]
AHPADPERGYGWEKLFTEQLCLYYRGEFGLETRIVRLHNVYGPLGTYDGGREKAPAALCRKVALAEDGGEIELWGDGKQTRSFLYINDCIEGIRRFMDSESTGPLNLGTDRLVTMDELALIIADIAGKKLRIRHVKSEPQGVRGRNSDNTLVKETIHWEPQTSLEDGLRETYRWIEDELKREGRV